MHSLHPSIKSEDATTRHPEEGASDRRGSTAETVREQKVSQERSNHEFSQLVMQQLAPEVRELWIPMADNFDRDGPEAARVYLDAERERLEENVRSHLQRFKES